jgi:hypothetical protein
MIIASMLMSAIPTRVASAHHPELSGTATCQTDGTYLITWTINNWSGTTLPMTITAIDRSVGVPVGTVVSSSVQGTEILPGNTSADITLTVSGSWSNGATGTTTSAKVKLNGKCTPPPPPDYQLNLSHIMCVDGQVEIHFVLLNVPDGITPGTLTYTYGTIVPGNHTGNVWHYTDYQPSGTYNVLSASVVVNGVTVNLHNPGVYAGDYQCSPPPPPTVTICYNNRTMTVPVADLGQYPGYTEGTCPPPPPVTICYNNQTMVVAVADLGQYPGYTEGACPPPPTMITICFNNQTMTVPLTSLGLYPGFTQGECPPPPVTICYDNETMSVPLADLEQYPGYLEGECLPPAVPQASLKCYSLETSVFKVEISNSGPSGEIGYSTDLDSTIVSLGTVANLGSVDVEIPGNATTLFLHAKLQAGWDEPVEIPLNKADVRVCEEDPISLVPFCSYQSPDVPHGWTVTNLNAFAISITWVYGAESSPLAIDLLPGEAYNFYTSDQPGEMMNVYVDGVLLASGEPAFCTEFAALDLTPICAQDAGGFNGWRVTNANSGDTGFEFSITASPVSGFGTVPANSFVEFSTAIVSNPDTLLLYSNGILQDTASSAGNCVPPSDNPPPPVVIQRIPIPVTGSSEQTVLIPVTGVDLSGSGKPVSGLLLNLGFGFFGLGLVVTGLNRKRNK